MAVSKCPQCEGNEFELKAVVPKGSRFKLSLVQCAHCGAVVGVTDYYNTASLLEKIAERLGFKLTR